MIGDVYCVKLYVTKYIDLLPIKDEYKECFTYSYRYGHTKILKVEKLDDCDINCRTIKVNGGALLIGYSLIPVF